jgi:nucleotide-binding universal stress UspA family protein
VRPVREKWFRQRKESFVFGHILIPTDGSPVAKKAVNAGIALARQLGAKVTGCYVIEGLQPHIYGEGYLVRNREIAKAYEQSAREVAEREIKSMGEVATAAGVPFNGVATVSETPYMGIIDTAKKHKCDAIFMASHGRNALAGLVLGSVTQKVLEHTKLPVLVYR